LALGDRDREPHAGPAEPVEELVLVEPRVGSHDDRVAAPSATQAGQEFVDESDDASGGVDGAFAQPGVEDLAGVGAGGQQRVVAEDLGVAVRGAGLGVAVDLTDRGVHIDDQRGGRASASTPGPLDRFGDDGFELADMTKGERPQKRAQRRWGHDPVPEHRASRPGPEPVGVVDAISAADHGVDQREGLATRSGPADAAGQAHRRVDQRLEPETGRDRGHQQQARISDERLVIEGHLDAVDPVVDCH
jgi:hypothetical protein